MVFCAIVEKKVCNDGDELHQESKKIKIYPVGILLQVLPDEPVEEYHNDDECAYIGYVHQQCSIVQVKPPVYSGIEKIIRQQDMQPEDLVGQRISKHKQVNEPEFQIPGF